MAALLMAISVTVQAQLKREYSKSSSSSSSPVFSTTASPPFMLLVMTRTLLNWLKLVVSLMRNDTKLLLMSRASPSTTPTIMPSGKTAE